MASSTKSPTSPRSTARSSTRSRRWATRSLCGGETDPRLADSFETALSMADGVVYAENADSGERTVFSSRFACPVSGFTIEEIEPRLFSFNTPHGACPACDGLGVESFFDPALVVPDDRRPLVEGAIAPWTGAQSP